MLTVALATFCAERIHKNQPVPHTQGGQQPKGKRRTHCDYKGTLRRVWTPSFFVPVVACLGRLDGAAPLTSDQSITLVKVLSCWIAGFVMFGCALKQPRAMSRAALVWVTDMDMGMDVDQ